ncbi:MAG: hypothetical protein K8S98_08545 [Planctomycetes bacterium]|nr:hypothetical protein [Planctomycetota bacterium]
MFAFPIAAVLLSLTSTNSGSVGAPSVARELRIVRSNDALSAHASTALERLNAVAQVPFHAQASRENGAALNLLGGRLATTNGDASSAALAFLAEHGAIFGLPGGLDATTEVRGANPLRVYVRYSLAGVPIEGLGAMVEVDALERIVAAHVRGGRGANALGSFDLDQTGAEWLALDELPKHRTRLGKLAKYTGEVPRAWRVWLAADGGLTPAYRIEFVSKRQGEAYSLYVDASSKRVVRTVDRAQSGTGNYPFFGNLYPFKTGSATCSTYTSMSKAIAAKSSSKSMKDWSLGVAAPVNLPKGFMAGARFDVYDDNGADPFSTKGSFKFNPLSQPDAFDVANTGFEINSAYAHLKKNLGHDLGSNFAMPLLVNVKDTTLNAFFTPSAFPDGHVDGFMLFFDNTQLGSVEADFSRDPSVVDHEYTHAWSYFEGESFEDPVDYPTRAANEAIADFFALAKQKDTVIGRYIEFIYTGIGLARDLQDDDHLVPIFDDAITLTVSGLPEEHRMGEVLGSFMTDVRMELGAKKAMRIVYDALPFIPNDMATAGFVTVDSNNAFDAVTSFFSDFAAGMLAADLAAGGKNQGAIHGAAAARGVSNNLSATTAQLIDLASFSKGKLKIPSAFVIDGDTHVYAFQAPLNAKLTLTVAGKGDVRPDFQFLSGTITELATKVVSDGGRKVSEKSIQLVDVGGTYTLAITNAGDVGTYTLTLDI